MRRLCRVIVLTVLSILWCGPSTAQNSDPEVTSGAIHARNGRYWNRLSIQQKLAYLIGFQEAAEFIALTTVTGPYEQFKEVHDRYLGQSTFGEIIDSLDAFYAEPANRPLAIIGAMAWYQNKVNGCPAAQLQEQLEKMRANVNAR